MPKTRTLNLIDIMQLKKDLLWGKSYYGLFDRNKLIDTVLFSNYFDNRYLVEIHGIEQKSREFVNQFTHDYATRRHIRYFVRELDEVNQVSDIEFMHSCGFKRFNRNYCFEYDSSKHSPNDHIQPKVFCRELDRQDIVKLIEIDASAQIIEYRDELHKKKLFFKKHFEEISVFTSSSEIDNIYGFAYKRDLGHGSTFEFVVYPRHSEIINDCINAFAERYIHFEKSSTSFRFIINENHKTKFDELQKDYDLAWTSQLLILEGAPKEKSPELATNLAFNQTRSPAGPLSKSNT